MRSLWRNLRPASSRTASVAPLLRSQIRHIADARPFRPGDSVVLRKRHDRSAQPIFIPRLVPGKETDRGAGCISHDSVIGVRVRDVITSLPAKSVRKGKRSRIPTEYRVHQTTLDEYVRMTSRLVTPIYPHDAGLIVSLLDLHPDPPGETGETASASGACMEANAESPPKLEILEAGTGHGSFTLYLSRAIHAANRPFSEVDAERNGGDQSTAFTEWKARRRAIVHSVELSSAFAKRAKQVVSGFRGGMYARNVDFHNRNVGEWVTEALAERNNSAFLSHAFLDMPSADLQVPNVAKALRTDGTLIMFNPSITQIMQIASVVREQGVPLELDRVIELGVNGGSGGREWDVRRVRPRALVKGAQGSSAESAFNSEGTSEDQISEVVDESTDGEAQAEDSSHETLVEDNSDGDLAKPDDLGVKDEEISSRPESVPPVADSRSDWVFVCRPKVGERITGGGFLGVWKKTRDYLA